MLISIFKFSNCSFKVLAWPFVGVDLFFSGVYMQYQLDSYYYSKSRSVLSSVDPSFWCQSFTYLDLYFLENSLSFLGAKNLLFFMMI